LGEFRVHLVFYILSFCWQARQSCSYSGVWDKRSNFEERLTVLEKTAEKYFVTRPHQEAEGELAWECLAARQLAKRRNEIAHGIVDTLHLDLENGAEKALESLDEELEYKLHPRYFVVPPHHAYLKYEAPGQYYYCSQNLKHFAETFERLRGRISRFTEALSR
jgi:hypothetical protein